VNSWRCSVWDLQLSLLHFFRFIYTKTRHTVFPLASKAWPHNNEWHRAVTECYNILWYFVSLSIYGRSHGSVIVTLTKAMGWKVKGLNHSRANIFLSSKMPRSTLGPTQPTFSGHQVLGFSSGSTGTGVCSWSLTFIWGSDLEWVELYLLSCISLHVEDTHTHSHTYTHMHASTHTVTCTHTHTHTHTHTNTHTQSHTHTLKGKYTCMHTHTCANHMIGLPIFY